jgi:hypothetical protein
MTNNTVHSNAQTVSHVVQSQQKSVLPLHIKQALLKQQKQAQEVGHYSNNLTRLLDSSGDCV